MSQSDEERSRLIDEYVQQEQIRCDVGFCSRLAVTVLVGESGDFWLCGKHRVPAYTSEGEQE